MSWTLEAISEEIIGKNIVIDHDMLVGRHQDCDIILQSSLVSRKHAVLTLDEHNQLFVEDLDSSNGVFVNDLKIDKITLLNNQDILQFANIKFLVIENAKTSVPSIEAQDEKLKGRPEEIVVPKPAPMPENIEQSQTQPIVPPEKQSEVQQEVEQQKNTSVGLITVIILLLIAILVWFFFFK